MYRLLVVTAGQEERLEVPQGEEGDLLIQCVPDLEEYLDEESAARPDAVLLAPSLLNTPQAREVVALCRQQQVPVLSVVPAQRVADFDPATNATDFILYPFRPGELTARVGQAVVKTRGIPSHKTIRVGDLLIDTERYEVTVAGRKVLLTFKEYQLLTLLASNPGRVYTREALLSQIWGYDYFGGMRTVDVHVRRLRSKIEDANHVFIETVWNVGYRFKESP